MGTDRPRGGRSRRARVAGWALALLALPGVLSAQSERNVELGFGILAVRPYLSDSGSDLFAAIGDLRPGPGAAFGLGYGDGRFSGTIFVEVGGLELGPHIIEGGIDMGRATALFWSWGLSGTWRPARRFGRFQPFLTAGYVKEGVGSVIMRVDQLPAYAQDPAADPAEEGAAGVSGTGGRLALGVDRELSDTGLPGDLMLRVQLSGDLVSYSRMSFDGAGQALDRSGVGLTPALQVGLLWRP